MVGVGVTDFLANLGDRFVGAEKKFLRLFEAELLDVGVGGKAERGAEKEVEAGGREAGNTGELFVGERLGEVLLNEGEDGGEARGVADEFDGLAAEGGAFEESGDKVPTEGLTA